MNAPPKPRLHIGGVAAQLADASGTLRSSLAGLRNRLLGPMPPQLAVNDMGNPIIAREPNTEPSIADQLGHSLDLLAECHQILEHMHKEVSRG